MVTRQLASVFRFKVQLLAALIIALALCVSLLRLSVWLLPHYQNQLKQWISTEAYQVDFAQLIVEWEQGLPQLKVDHGVLSTPDGHIFLAADQAELRIDWLESLLLQRPVFNYLMVSGLSLNLQEDSGGHWYLAGWPATDQPDDQPPLYPLLEGLAHHDLVQLKAVALNLKDKEGDAYSLTIEGELQGRLQGLDSSFVLRDPNGQETQLRASMDLQNGSVAGQFYLKIPTVAYWQSWLYKRFPDLAGVSAGGEIWGSWQEQQIKSLSADLAVAEFAWNYQQALVSVNDLQIRSHWQHDESGWQFVLSPSQGRINGAPIPLDQLKGHWQSDQLLFDINMLDLGILNYLVLHTPQVPEALQQELAVLAPTGLLKSLRLALPLKRTEKLPPFMLNAELAGVSVAAWNGAPQIENISGQLFQNEQGGAIKFASQPLFLSFPELFSQGWGLNSANGLVQWRITDQQVWVESDLLEAAMNGITAHGRFSLYMPFAKEQASEFSLLIGTEQGRGTLTPLLVPDKVVNQDLYQWLSQAVVDGTVASGSFLYHGPLESWSEDPSIQMYFDVENALIQYSLDWPAVSNVDADVLVKDTALLVEASKGQIYDSQLDFTEVYLPSGSQHLKIQGQVKGAASDARRVLLSSPVSNALGDEFSRWSLTGQTTTRLDLDLNLAEMDDSRYQVNVDLSGGRYFSEIHGLSIDGIQGAFHYDDRNGLNAKGIKARFFDRPILARVDTQTTRQETHTVIRADGHLAIVDLNQWLQLPLLELTEGETQYSAFVDICQAKSHDCSSLRVISDLQGISTRLIPEPYGKTAKQQRHLDLRTELGGQQNWLRLRLDDDLEGLLLIDEQGLKGGELVFGQGQPQPRQRLDGLWIKGYVPEFDVFAWQSLGEKYTDKTISDQGTVTIDPLLKNVQLQLGKLVLAEGFAFDDMEVQLAQVAEGRQLAFDSAKLKGQVLLPENPGVPYQFDFDRLYLPPPATPDESESLAAAKVEEEGVDPLAEVTPSEIPPARIRIDDLRQGERQLGSWLMNFDPFEEGLKVTAFEGQNEALNIIGSLQWLRQQGGHFSKATFEFTSPELAKVQNLFDVTPVIESKDVEIKGSLFWQGSPLGFNRRSLTGDLKLSGKQGRFIDTGGTTDALKLFGILNFNNLGRRLRLDFKDLSQQGLSFDTISGQYRIDEGIATSAEPLKFTGPSADLEMNGQFNLVEKTLDQHLRLTLPISENLPLTALLLGTPQVAGAVFLFDKLMGKTLSQITSAEYQLSGSWSEPKIEPVKSAKADKAEDKPADGQ